MPYATHETGRETKNETSIFKGGHVMHTLLEWPTRKIPPDKTQKDSILHSS